MFNVSLFPLICSLREENRLNYRMRGFTSLNDLKGLNTEGACRSHSLSLISSALGCSAPGCSAPCLLASLLSSSANI